MPSGSLLQYEVSGSVEDCGIVTDRHERQGVRTSFLRVCDGGGGVLFFELERSN